MGYLLYYASDSIIISNMAELGPDMIVYYNVAQRWDPQVRVLVMAFVGTMLPMMTSMVSLRQTERLHSAFLRGTRYSLLIGALPALLLVIFAEPFLRHWVGDNFARVSAPVLQLIMLQFLVCLPERMAYNVNIAYGRMRGPVFVSLACGVLNVILSIVLVRCAGLGLLGIAAGSVVALLIVCGYSIVYTLRLLDMPATTWARQGCLRAMLATIPFLACAIAIRLCWPSSNLLEIFIQFGVASIPYAVGAWLIGLRAGERADLLAFARRALDRTRGSSTDA